MHSSSNQYAAFHTFLYARLFCTTLLSAAISVYIFHDVDCDKVGHWNEAFAGLCAEGGLFTLIVGGTVGFLRF